eukprot:TRINITY_DN1575_c0_g1_i1.p1 TRINITY_DN1575_c0_g1~~TRINITY_DN1575_c0_g1_i1.p1  ORF type:complete len:249 (-),score=88.31 TRINITY_DN1575_c0_g1_i1:120-866(-)
MSSQQAPKVAPFPVPESVLKKRKSVQRLRAIQKAEKVALGRRNRTNRKVIFKRAEQYVKEYHSAERALIRARRVAKQSGNFFREAEPKLAFVVRIRGINQVPPKPRKILQLLRLRQIHNGVFVRLNNATINMLRIIEPYVAYGTPNLKSVRELIYKRGFVNVSKQRVPLSDNSLIEKTLGRFGIICVEDLIHEVVTVGPHFKQVNKFLWPFKLSSPRGGFTKKTIHFQEGGVAGNNEEHINGIIRQMN